MTLDTTIGLYASYDNDLLVSVKELANRMKFSWSVFTSKQYCDFRYNTNLTRFIYDPYTGERIDWKWVEEQLNLLTTESTNG